MKKRISAVLLVTALVGCSRGAEIWHCTNQAKHSCSQWSEPDRDVRQKQQASCTAMGGAVADGPCPSDGAIGSCTASGSAQSRIVYYAPRDADEARAMCAKLGGTWR